jgi:glycosyltransferase involved in cell wall biosynthesis
LSEFYSTKFYDSPLLPNILTELVYDIIIGSSARAVFNLNCGTLWRAIEIYGRQLSSLTDLYAYVFCDDRDEFGNVDGYPANYLGATVTYFTKVFCDSDSLKDMLLTRLPFSKTVESKIVTLKTPVSYKTSNFRDFFTYNKKICWAGRFDVQKRPDLLIEIAGALPEYTFEVWGKKVIDSGIEYDFSKCSNIRLMGLFEDIEEVLESEPTLFLYTADWDGVPTILLKMMAVGIPIVASNVGGISEILPRNCIAETNDVLSFLTKIKQISEHYRAGNLLASYKSELRERNFDNYADVLRGNLKSV